MKCDLQDISSIITQFIQEILKSIAIARDCLSHPNGILANNLLNNMYVYGFKNRTRQKL